jgi:type II restriction enzyme
MTMNLGFEEAQTPFDSPSQNARVWTEQWVKTWLFCPNCGAQNLSGFEANRPVADFHCPTCAEEFELKAQKTPIGRKVMDGAFGTMCQRLEASNNPNLMLMRYDLERFGVTDLFLVPKQFFVRDIIEKRKPLAPTARRAGWVGCNIVLEKVPESGKVHVVRDRQLAPKALVLEQWKSTLFLRDQGLAGRGWLIEVMKCVDLIGAPTFTLDDVYAYEQRLSALYPGNRNVRPKIRQQLQVLRDNGYLDFVGRGRYRLRAAIM